MCADATGSQKKFKKVMANKKTFDIFHRIVHRVRHFFYFVFVK